MTEPPAARRRGGDGLTPFIDVGSTGACVPAQTARKATRVVSRARLNITGVQQARQVHWQVVANNCTVHVPALRPTAPHIANKVVERIERDFDPARFLGDQHAVYFSL